MKNYERRQALQDAEEALTDALEKLAEVVVDDQEEDTISGLFFARRAQEAIHNRLNTGWERGKPK